MCSRHQRNSAVVIATRTVKMGTKQRQRETMKRRGKHSQMGDRREKNSREKEWGWRERKGKQVLRKTWYKKAGKLSRDTETSSMSSCARTQKRGQRATSLVKSCVYLHHSHWELCLLCCQSQPGRRTHSRHLRNSPEVRWVAGKDVKSGKKALHLCQQCETQIIPGCLLEPKEVWS